MKANEFKELIQSIINNDYEPIGILATLDTDRHGVDKTHLQVSIRNSVYSPYIKSMIGYPTDYKINKERDKYKKWLSDLTISHNNK